MVVVLPSMDIYFKDRCVSYLKPLVLIIVGIYGMFTDLE